jgi:hypothetical protein
VTSSGRSSVFAGFRFPPEVIAKRGERQCCVGRSQRAGEAARRSQTPISRRRSVGDSGPPSTARRS